MTETTINTFITPAVFTLILSLVFFFLYKEEGQKYLLFWAIAWFINGLGFILSLINHSIEKVILLQVLNNCCLILSAVFFIIGSLKFCGKKSGYILFFISVLGILWSAVGFYLDLAFFIILRPLFIMLGIAFILTGLIYLTLSESKKIGKYITASSLLILGLNNVLLPFLSAWMIPMALIYLVGTVAKLGLTIGMLVLYFERHKSNLNRTQTSYKVVAENTPDIIFRYSFQPRQQLEYINPAFTKATGYSCDDLLANPSLFKKILHPDYHYLVTQILTSKFKSVRRLDFVVYHKDGQMVYLESNIVPHYSADGQLIAIEGIIRDVTQSKLMEAEIKALEEKQKKQTEMALCTAEDRFSKAFYNSPYPMAIISKDFTNIDVNYSFEESTGYYQYDLINIDILQSIFNDDYLNIKDLIEKGTRIRNVRFRFLNKSGQQRLGLLSTEEIVIDGRQSVFLIINDITEINKMENELARLDRLNLVGQMAAGISHEVRNPMTTVRGLLQFLGGKEQYNDIKKHFDLMISEIDRANNIITEFLSLSKNIPEELRTYNLNNILTNLQYLLQADALTQGKNIVLELSEVPDIRVNRKEIHQLILNLVRNGLEAMQKGGTVKIKTLLDRSEVVLSVEDEGSGIDSLILERLGTPFLTTKAEGTGLGLATCYGIAERHNAIIDVDSNPKGTVFNIRFKIGDYICLKLNFMVYFGIKQ